MKKIVVLDQKTLGNDIDISAFNNYGEVKINSLTSPDNVENEIKDAEIIILNKIILNESNLKNAKNLKLICLLATGYNNIDTDYCKKRGIAVCNVAGYSTKSVAQHTISMVLSLIENINFYDKYIKNGNYAKSDTPTFHGRPYFQLYQKTWGIIGLGDIGKEVANLAEAFGCNIIYYSTSGKNVNNLYKSYSLNELLTKSDIISIHCPLNKDTENLITYKEFSKMKKNCIIANLARGKIINETDLAKALKENLIKGACIDVFENEPVTENCPLLDKEIADKLIMTPHIAWASIESRNSLIKKVCENIESFYNGGNLNRIV